MKNKKISLLTLGTVLAATSIFSLQSSTFANENNNDPECWQVPSKPPVVELPIYDIESIIPAPGRPDYGGVEIVSNFDVVESTHYGCENTSSSSNTPPPVVVNPSTAVTPPQPNQPNTPSTVTPPPSVVTPPVQPVVPSTPNTPVQPTKPRPVVPVNATSVKKLADTGFENTTFGLVGLTMGVGIFMTALAKRKEEK